MIADMQAVIDVLRGKRFPLEDEKVTQAAVFDVLSKAFAGARREVPIKGGVIDFIVGAAGIELKVKGQKRAIARQVREYAKEPALSGFIVMTATPLDLPAEFRGKPVRVFNIARAWL